MDLLQIKHIISLQNYPLILINLLFFAQILVTTTNPQAQIWCFSCWMLFTGSSLPQCCHVFEQVSGNMLQQLHLCDENEFNPPEFEAVVVVVATCHTQSECTVNQLWSASQNLISDQFCSLCPSKVKRGWLGHVTWLVSQDQRRGSEQL